jgi:PKD repeat protein
MHAPGRLFAIVLFLLLLLPVSAQAQYLFLDTNGDAIHDERDRIDLNGLTVIDIWLDTSSNKDGSATACDVDAGIGLDICSWEVALRAVGGALEWGPLDNHLPLSTVHVCFASGSDTTDPVWYHNGWGGNLFSPPGRYHLASLRVKVLSGEPSLTIRPFDPYHPNNLTSFGTHCPTSYDDHTDRLGVDWFDADGLVGGLTPDAGGPYVSHVGRAVPFDASETLNPSGRPVTFAWDFGDGDRGEGPAPFHVYRLVGDYRVTLNASDGETSRSTWTTVKVLVNTPPVARAGGPYTGGVGAWILFDGRSSSDPEGDLLSYRWDFGNGQSDNGASVRYAYWTAGVYTVTLTVSDGLYTDSDITSARISSTPERPPIASAGGPYHGYAGLRIDFDGSGSSDPDGDPITYRWLFGDATESAMRSPRHVYQEAGLYEVILEVSDGVSTVSDVTSATIEVPVGSPPAVVIGGPYEGLLGGAITFDAGASSDPDGDALSFEWDFGDGATAPDQRAAHAYHDARVYTVSLRVSDGMHEVLSGTTATVRRPSARARAWSSEDEIVLSGSRDPLVIRIEPIDTSFRLDEVNYARFTLALSTPEGSQAVPAGYAVPGSDSDQNGIAEAVATFPAEVIRALLGSVDRPRTVTLQIDGALLLGDSFQGTFTARVIPSGAFAAVVRPNPFNPQAVVTFMTTKPGSVRAQLFNLAGRLVKTVLQEQRMQPGAHDLVLEARGDDGGTLASGVYFLRIAGPDGSMKLRVAVAK